MKKKTKLIPYKDLKKLEGKDPVLAALMKARLEYIKAIHTYLKGKRA